MNELEKAKRDIIQECKEDIVSVWYAMSCIEHRFPDKTPDWIRSNTLKVIGEILEEEDWLYFVSLENEQFVRWELPSDRIIAHIEEEWIKLDRRLMSPDIGWLSQWPI